MVDTIKKIGGGWVVKDAKPWLDRFIGKLASVSTTAWIVSCFFLAHGMVSSQDWTWITLVFIFNRMVAGKESLIELVKAWRGGGTNYTSQTFMGQTEFKAKNQGD
jgi:hypothetical protein